MSQERKSHVRKSRFGSQFRSRQKALEKARAEERKLYETKKKNRKDIAGDDDEVIFHLNSELNGSSGRSDTQIPESEISSHKKKASADKRSVHKSARPQGGYYAGIEPGNKKKNRKKTRSTARRTGLKIFGGAAILCVVAIGILMIRLQDNFLNTIQDVVPDKVLEVAEKIVEPKGPPVDMVATKEISFEPHYVDSTAPSNYITSTDIEVDGNILGSVSEYTPDGEISFLVGEDYTEAEGIVTFRGNNFRDSAAYGTAEMTDYTLTQKWSHDTGSLSSG